MNLLKKLSPAESLLLVDIKKATQKELLKVTFMDLLLKQVLRTYDVKWQASQHDAPSLFKCVERGVNFHHYFPNKHEEIFTRIFKESSKLRIPFRLLVRIGFENSDSQKKYQSVILLSDNLIDCFNVNFFQIFFGGYSLTQNGKEIQSKLLEEINFLEKTFIDLVNSDKEKALEILKEIKGNVFLLSNLNFELLDHIDKEFLSEINSINYQQVRSGCSGSWDSYYHYSTTFDSVSNTESESSGCWGDSSGGDGDSGCSGCGGCGGD